MPNLSVSEPKQETSAHQCCTTFENVNAIESWIDELRASRRSADLTRHDWRMLSRAVMISHPEPSVHVDLVRRVAEQVEVDFISLTADDFVEWVIEGHIPSNQLPALVFVRQGSWSAKHDDCPEQVAQFREALPKYISKLKPQQWLVFVTTGSGYANLDPALRTVGLFDRRFDLPEPTHEELGQIFLREVGHNVCDESLLQHPIKVGRLIEVEFNEKRRYGLIALAMQRLAHREQRKLSFDDLVHFSIFGGGEGTYPQETDPDKLRRNAIHETGHAIISILDSNGNNIPDYVGLVSSQSFLGTVTESFAFNQSRCGTFSFSDSCHKIRISLAGRAAEAFFLGAESVSSMGARSDLVTASNIAKDLVGRLGFSADHDNDHPDALNLLVFDDEPSLSEMAHIEKEARRLLVKQYGIVTKLIRDNQPLFESIQQTLMAKRVLTQSDLHRIMNNPCHQPTKAG